LTPANGSIFNTASGGMHFTASTIDPFSIASDKVGLVLNGNDLSAGLVVSGPPTARSALYTNLAANQFYTGQIWAVDNLGHGTTNFVSFDTFSTNGVVVIETEDYNHDGGQFTDNPIPGAYAGLTGVPDVDYHTAGAFVNDYRPNDPLDIPGAVETRPHFITAGVNNHAVTGWEVDDWLNYTRTFPNARYRAYLRYGALQDRSIQLDLVTGDRTQPNQTVTAIGAFNAAQINSDAIYRYAALTNANGDTATVALSGVQTLRLTGSDTTGGLTTDFLMLVPFSEQPRLTISSGGNQVTLSFATVAGLTYTLEYKDRLADPTWGSLSPTVAGDGTVKSVSQPAGQPARFYRLSAQ
jgi:hypothetical protein